MPAGYPRSWEPRELSPAVSTGLALLILALMLAFGFGAYLVVVPPRQPEVIQVTQAQLVQLPAPTPPPPPPKVIPPPKPVPVVIPKPPPIPSKIAVAVKPPPPIHRVVHVPKPIHHVEQPPPPMPVQPPTPAPPAPPAPVQDNSGQAEYGAQMHDIIQANQDVPPALAQLGVSGTAYIRIAISPNGHVVSASVVRSSGVPLIDQTALEHARDAAYPPFNAHMIGQVQVFTVPVEIDASQ